MKFKIQNSKFKIIFLIVILLAAVLRLWNLSNFPAGFNADEASIGYNAYSLLLTGKDEYGTSWPLAFKSFGDYKPGLYFYLVLPFVATFGLNELAVRLPSALFGIGTVVLIFFLAKEIFKQEKVGLLSALLLAVSPWHIHFSRGGWETNVATFFITLGVLFLIKGLEKNIFLFWSLFSFLISMYTYQSPRLVIPVLIFVLAILYRSKRKRLIVEIKKRYKRWVIGFATVFMLSIPLIFQFIGGGASSRFSGLSFLSDTGPASRVNELRGEHEESGGIAPRIIHNKLTSYGPNFLGHYLDHFKGDFLFISGDPLIRNKVPETGQFFLIEALFLVIGLAFLIKQKYTHTKLLITWILVAPLASSMTFQTPHGLRALNMVVPLTMICALGLSGILGWLGRLGNRWKVVVAGLIFVLLTFEFIHYMESYYIHYPKRYPLAWEYGFKEMVSKLNQYEPRYNNVVITDRYDQPYILVLFYKKYDPARYQPQASLSPRDKFNFGTIRQFDKYEFHSIKALEFQNAKGTLFIGTEQEIPVDAKLIDRVYFPSGEVAFIFAGT